MLAANSTASPFPEANMTTKRKIVAVSSICTASITGVLGTVAGFPARADDLGAAVYNGVNQLRPTCAAIGDDRRLTLEAQRHANDILTTGVDGHTGSDGSSPQPVLRMLATPRPGTPVRSSTGAPDRLRLRPQRSTCGCKVLRTARSSWIAPLPPGASPPRRTPTR